MSTDLPPWIFEGARVAAVGGNGGNEVDVVTVERLTVTQIVAGPRRYRRRDLREVGGGEYTSYHLERLDDPWVVGRLARNALRRLVAQVDNAASPPKGAEPAEVLAVLDRIEALVASTRATVEKLSKES